MITNRQCVVSLTTLQAVPYSLVFDDDVQVKIVSINLYGESDQSLAGSGAKIQVVPDAPISLANNPLVTDATKIGLTWSQGVSNGGTVVLDYKLLYTLESTNSFEELEGALTDTSYTTSVTLQVAQNYKFKV